MKIIVVSDTHGDIKGLEAIFELHQNAEIFVHCGDSRGEMLEMQRRFPEKRFVMVKGNCDFSSDLPEVETFEAEGVTFFVTHGHFYNVKFSFMNLVMAAQEAGADVALFGHTHQAADATIKGVHLFNPGACGGWHQSYGVIEVKNGEVLTSHASIRRGR